MDNIVKNTVATDTQPATTGAAQDKAQRFTDKAESQASRAITELEKLRKLSNRKYYVFTEAQVQELFGAIQATLDEVKNSFITGNVEKKKLFTFSK